MLHPRTAIIKHLIPGKGRIYNIRFSSAFPLGWHAAAADSAHCILRCLSLLMFYPGSLWIRSTAPDSSLSKFLRIQYFCLQPQGKKEGKKETPTHQKNPRTRSATGQVSSLPFSKSRMMCPNDCHHNFEVSCHTLILLLLLLTYHKTYLPSLPPISIY